MDEMKNQEFAQGTGKIVQITDSNYTIISGTGKGIYAINTDPDNDIVF